MTVQVYLGREFEHAHEMRALGSFLEAMIDRYASHSEPFCILASYYCSRREIDLTVLKRNAVVLVELKDCADPVVGTAFGEWRILTEGSAGAVLNYGRANPFQQVRTSRMAWINFLDDNKHRLLPPAKLEFFRPDHVSAWIAFSPALNPQSQITIEGQPRWFRLSGLSELPQQLYMERSSYLDFSAEELRLLAEDLLGCKRCEARDLPFLSDRHLRLLFGDAKTPGRTSVAELEIEKPIGCFICESGAMPCQLARLSGSVLEIRQRDGSASVLMLPDDYIPTWLHLNAPWHELAEPLSKLLAAHKSGKRDQPNLSAYHLEERIHDGNISYATTSDSLVVLEPNLLVNASSLAQYVDCPMRYLITRMSSEPPKPETVRGNVVHDGFRRMIRAQSSARQALSESLSGHVFEMALAGVAASRIEDDAGPHLFRLRPVAAGGTRRGAPQFETLALSPQLGLTGRIDCLWEEESSGLVTGVLELKTGKAKWNGAAAWPADEAQAAAYAVMLWNSGLMQPQAASVEVAYTGGDVLKDIAVDVDRNRLQRIIRARNRAAELDLLDVVPGDGGNCQRNCPGFFSLPCNILRDVLGPGPQTQQQTAGNWRLTPGDRSFARTYFPLLMKERRAALHTDSRLFTMTVEERVEDGTCIRLQRVVGRYDEALDRWRYVAECDNRSEIRLGDWVVVSDGRPAGGRVAQAEVESVDAGEVTFLTNEEIGSPQIIDAGLSANMLDRSFSALYLWLQADRRIRELVYGERQPTFGAGAPIRIPDLNGSQNDAVTKAVRMQDYLLVWGPPGTGKTKVIGAIAKQLPGSGQRVLLTAFTNQAVDNLCNRLLAEGIGDFVILGERRRSVAKLQPHTLSEMVQARIKPGADLETRRRTTAQILSSNPIVVSTAYGLASARYDSALPRQPGVLPFDVVVVDEASQMTVPITIGAIRLAKRFILVGDHMQLPPVIRSESPDDQTAGDGPRLSESLFEVLWGRHNGGQQQESPCATLLTQYRMNQKISDFPNREWYLEKLVAHESVMNAVLKIPSRAAAPEAMLRSLDPQMPAVLVHIGHRFAKVGTEVPKRYHLAEAEYVFRLVEYALARGLRESEVGVITPYRAQAAAIRRRLSLVTSVSPAARDRVLIDTVDRFQGSERELVIISFATYDQTVGPLLRDIRRLNVAMTRARSKLIMVGDLDVLSQVDVYARLIAYVNSSLYPGGRSGIVELSEHDLRDIGFVRD